MTLGCGTDRPLSGSARRARDTSSAVAQATERGAEDAQAQSDGSEPATRGGELLFGPERCVSESTYSSYTFAYGDTEFQGAILRVEPATDKSPGSVQIRLNGRVVLSEKESRLSGSVIERSISLEQRNVLTVLQSRASGGVVVSIVRSPVQIGRVSMSQDWLPVGEDHVLDISLTVSIAEPQTLPTVSLYRVDSRGTTLMNEGTLSTEIDGAHPAGRLSRRFRIAKTFRIERKGMIYFRLGVATPDIELRSEVLDVEVLKPFTEAEHKAHMAFEHEVLAAFDRWSLEGDDKAAADQTFDFVKRSPLVQSASLGDGDGTIYLTYKTGEIGMIRLARIP